MDFFNIVKNRNITSKGIFQWVIFLCIILFSTHSFSQAYLETFGQNRIQTRKFEWRFFDTEHFKIYHYDAAGRQLARYVAEQAEKDIRIIERKMGGSFPRRFSIVLYNSYDDYRQTNVGRKNTSQTQDLPTGTVDIVGDKLVVYYTGVHTDVHRQLRAGMSRVVMERMLFGETLKEIVKNAVSLNLPAWVTSGFIAYLVDGWDTESETNWKNFLQAHPAKGFYELSEEDPELSGKAFWKFISANYGESNVKNLLYSMQMKGNLNNGLKMTVGMDVKRTYDSVIRFYNDVYEKDAFTLETPDSSKAILHIKVPDDRTLIRNIRVSPRGRDVAYVTWLDGEFNVYIQHTTGDQTKTSIVSGGIKDYNEFPDPDYPLLAWNNTGYKLAILYRKKNQTRLRIYDGLKSKLQDYIVPQNRFDRVLGITFMEDDLRLIFSTVKKSQTDLYEFRLKGSRLTPITNDIWDDVQPWYVSGGARKGIVFLSNRPQPNLQVPAKVNELPTGPMNAYFYDTKTKSSILLQLSHITKGNITQPIQYGSENFAYLYDTNGVVNKYVVLFGRTTKNMDSTYSVPVTNYSHSILFHQYNPASMQIAEVIQIGKDYNVYFRPLDIPGKNMQPKELHSTTLSGSNNVGEVPVVEPSTIPADVSSSVNSNVQTVGDIRLQSGTIFQSEFSEEPPKEDLPDTSPIVMVADTFSKIPELSILSDEDSILVDSSYVKMRAQPYRLSFKPDFFSFKFDNSILFTKYQPIDQSYSMPIGAMLTISLNDALENIRLTGGIRLPVNFSGMNYFLQYENVTRRVDWNVLLLRTENYQKVGIAYTDSSNRIIYVNTDQVQKTTTNLVQGTAIYPLDRVHSIRMHLGFRQDILNYKAQDYFSLTYANPAKRYWTLSRVEYVHDNTKMPALNILNGVRLKLFGEYFYELSKPNGGLYNFGTDIRYYKKIYKNIILASRGTYAHSGGNKKINYIMGGVDNWFFSKQDPFGASPSQNFGFQALATNLRGYKQNARNGNTYGLINVELRAPVLSTFMKRPIQNTLLKNLQLVGFLDAGNAWNGLLPTKENTPRYYTFPQFTTNTGYNPVTVLLSPPRTDLAVGYGAGLRTMVFGYFLRIDAAWNIEGLTMKPIWYFSLGTDF